MTFEDESDDPTKIVHYTYDVHDRLIQKSVDLGADDDIDRAEYYRYDGTNVWFEAIDADGDGPADPALNFYLWGPAVDQLLARTDAENGQTLWMLTDHQGTIRDLVDGQLGSPTEGEVVNHLTYDAYGQLLDQTASDPAFQTRYGYTGQELDAETGLMYYNARWYDPRNGRFISEDPIGINGGDYNLSRYVGNSPANWIDPSGMEPAIPLPQPGYSDEVTIITDNSTTGDSASWGYCSNVLNRHSKVRSINELIAILENHVKSSKQKIRILNISGHGNAGGFRFSNETNLRNRLTDDEAKRIRSLLAEGATINLYICSTAQGALPQNLADQLNATVNASVYTTGPGPDLWNWDRIRRYIRGEDDGWRQFRPKPPSAGPPQRMLEPLRGGK